MGTGEPSSKKRKRAQRERKGMVFSHSWWVSQPCPLSCLSGAQETLCPPKIPQSRLAAGSSALP